MNASEFGTELDKVLRRAFDEGLLNGKITPVEFLGVLDLKHDEARTKFHAVLAAVAAQHKQTGIVQPGDRRFQLPPNGE